MNVKIDTTIQLIKDLYNISFTYLDTDEQINHYIHQNISHHIQYFFDLGNFKSFLNTLQSNFIYYLTDRLQLHYILFLVEKKKVCLGPFYSLILTEQNLQMLLEQYQLANFSVLELQTYRSQFPMISERDSIHIATSVLKVMDPSNFNRTIQRTSFYSDSASSNYHPKEDVQEINYPHMIQQRYSLEQRFMADIKNGNSRAAILNLRNMQQDVAHLKTIGTTLENERIGAAIVRTIVRIAALNAGLPAIIIDLLSNSNTVAISKATSVEEIYSEKENMIRAFCKEIHIHNNRLYSNLIQSAIYSINRQATQNLSITQLAESLDVTPSYLITKFREETGLTPVAFINKTKMQQAATLLSRTTLSIQEISNLVGVTDSNYFVKLFKREYHQTPTHYRKYHKL